MSTDKELKPCPFCGSAARIGDFTGCSNNECFAADWHVLDELWNARASQSEWSVVAAEYKKENAALRLEITTLQQALEEAESEWISVSSGNLPEHNVGYECLVTFQHMNEPSCVSPAHYVNSDFCIFYRNDWKPIVNVTHWQPLPQPPKASK